MIIITLRLDNQRKTNFFNKMENATKGSVFTKYADISQTIRLLQSDDVDVRDVLTQQQRQLRSTYRFRHCCSCPERYHQKNLNSCDGQVVILRSGGGGDGDGGGGVHSLRNGSHSFSGTTPGIDCSTAKSGLPVGCAVLVLLT